MIDTHAHIYAEELDDKRTVIMQRAREAGVTKIVLPNVDSTTLQRMLDVERAYPEYCYAAIGVHPTSIGENWKEELAVVEQELKRRNEVSGYKPNSYIAIGETGTDLYWDKTYLRQQQEAFAQQLQWSLDYQLPIIIHIRNSFDETVEVLQDFKGKGLRGVYHSFTGTAEQAYTINELGTFYLGINGIVTFKNSGLREVMASVSPERLVLETDSPYLSPVPFRGKLNESSRLPLIVAELAAVYRLEPEKIVAITTRNAESLFNFKGNPFKKCD